jgi:hypothetical protein
VIGGAYGAYLYSDRCSHDEDCYITPTRVIVIAALGGLVVGTLVELVAPN